MNNTLTHICIYKIINELYTYTHLPFLQEPWPEHSHGQPSPRYTLSNAHTLPRGLELCCDHLNRVVGELWVIL